jgi:cellulose synthase/poly-beta-1,6-N-acetylglucosamine synthase-like glycosyltransferase
MIVSGYDGVGVRVIRGGSGTLSKFSTVDTTMWCDVTLPALKYAFNTALLSGEGLFVRKSALEAIGGFPESLTEDAHISLLFSQKGFMLALLDSTIYEGAPKSLKSMIRQKLRWHRGLFLCLRETLISKTPLSRKLTLTYTYSSPIVLVAIALSQVILTIGIAAPHLVPRPIFIWSLLVTFSTLSAPIYLALAKYRIPISVTLLMPLYWCAVGILTLYAFLCPWISWYKTSSRADFNPDRL